MAARTGAAEIRRPGKPLLIALLAVAGAAALLPGCTSVRPPKAPVDTFLHKSPCTSNARTLLVLLPGAYSTPDEFVREGYISAIEERQLAVDVLRVDAQLGYYTNGMAILKRLGEDVIAPARQKGYTSIWVTGISIGGLGALAYATLNPGQLDGIVAIAPYLGEHATGLDIANAGGLMRWHAPTSTLPGDNAEQRLWGWLQRYGAQPGAPDMPQLYLGFGRDDRFAFSHELLAAVLPADHVFRTEGGHDWPEWRRLWQDIVPALPLPRCASAPG